MEKKNIDWSNIGFGYQVTDKRYVSNYKNGAWDDGVLTDEATITLSECAGVLQYAQTCFEGLKAYTTVHEPNVMTELNGINIADFDAVFLYFGVNDYCISATIGNAGRF